MTSTLDNQPEGRTQLIKTALKLFSEKGKKAVTVRELAASANVSIGLIKHHFGSKDGLIDAVDDYFIEQFEDITAFASSSISDGELPFEGAFSDWIDQWISKHEGDSKVLFAYFRRALIEDTETGAKIFDKVLRSARDTVEQLNARGIVREDIDLMWLPFLLMYLELGTALLDPHIERVLGRSGFSPDLWERRHRAYGKLMLRGF